MGTRTVRPVLLAAAAGLMLLAGPALGADSGRGLGDKNVNVDPHTSFPGGTGAASGLGGQGGGRLSPSTMIDHPATADIAAGVGGTTEPPSAGRIGGTGAPSRR